jgi:D-lactate dehydrogenase (cytochrome)
VPLPSGNVIEAQLPTYQMPQVRKHASGYFVAQEMDVIDLFIGSEGTLGVIVEAELNASTETGGSSQWRCLLCERNRLLAFVRDARERSSVAQTSSLWTTQTIHRLKSVPRLTLALSNTSIVSP